MSKSQIKLFSFLGLFFLSLLLLLPENTSAGCCCPPCRDECGNEWCGCRRVYKALTLNCDPMVIKDSWEDQGCCGLLCSCPCLSCEGVGPCEDCGSWQRPIRQWEGENVCNQVGCIATNWGLHPNAIKPECKACDQCLKAPQNPRYYDNALYPLDPYQPEGTKDKDNIYLPVKLDWDDVPGWIGGWRVEDKKVVKKNQEGKFCEISFGAGQDIVECKKNCKNKCWQKMEEEWKGPEKNPSSKWNIGDPKTAQERSEKEVKKEEEYRDYLPKCIKSCEEECVESYKTSAGGICPYTGTVYHCDPAIDYVKSYIIEIEGDMRNPEALQKIAILERERELLESRFFKNPVSVTEPKEAIKRIEEINKEIEAITNQQLYFVKYGAALDKSEFIPAFSPQPGTGWKADGSKISIPNHVTSGFFQSNEAYKWRVRACIHDYKSYEEYAKAGGWSCGPWSESWQFKNNPAPETNLPYDPDWNGKKEDYPGGWKISGMAKELPKWEVRFLRWSEIDDDKEGQFDCKKWYQPRQGEKKGYNLTKSAIFTEQKQYCSPWSFQAFLHYKYSENETAKCHPQQKIREGGECLPLKIHRAPGWPGTGRNVARSEMPNDYYKFFTKLTIYDWQLQACIDDGGIECSDLSHKWQFSVEDFTLDKSSSITPPNNKEIEIGLPVHFEWSDPEGVLSYQYRIINSKGIFGGTTGPGTTADYPELSLDSLYKWSVQPCWDYEALKCESFWSDDFYFKTTGRPPKEETMKPAGTETPVPIPVTFEWEAVPGAKSYLFTLTPPGEDEGRPAERGYIKKVKEPKVTYEYPQIIQNSTYTWNVRACIRDDGAPCGKVSAPQEFTTFTLSSPQNPNPSDGGQFVTGERNYYLSWDEVPYAKAYQVKVDYKEVANEEPEKETCQTGPIISVAPKTITLSPSSDFIPLECLGEYEWSVRACLDTNCYSFISEAGEAGVSAWSGPWHFKLTSAPSSGSETPGLVPCGRKTDAPQTPWDETNPCEIRHIFILLRAIIDFLLWKIAPVLLVILGAVTAGILYLSASRETSPVVDVKRLWKAAGIGYGIIFLAWVIIDAILLIFNYRVGVFSPWWQFNF